MGAVGEIAEPASFQQDLLSADELNLIANDEVVDNPIADSEELNSSDSLDAEN